MVNSTEIAEAINQTYAAARPAADWNQSESVLTRHRAEEIIRELAALPAPAATQEPNAASPQQALAALPTAREEVVPDFDSLARPAPQEEPSEAWSLAKLLIDVPDNASDRISIKGTKMLASEVLRLSEERKRAADYILAASQDQLGSGDDPIGFLIASHAYLRRSYVDSSSVDVLRRIMEKLRSEDGTDGSDPYAPFAYDASWELLAREADAVLAAAPPRCTCYVLPHAEDCGLFIGITQTGERVYAPDAAAPEAP